MHIEALLGDVCEHTISSSGERIFSPFVLVYYFLLPLYLFCKIWFLSWMISP